MSWKLFDWSGKTRIANDAGEILTGPDGHPIELDAAAVDTKAIASVAAPLNPTSAPAAAAALDPTAIDIASHPAMKAAMEEIQALKTARETERVSARDAMATAFAGRFIETEKKLLPAARESLVSAYATAAEDDHQRPVAAGQPTRVQRLEAVLKDLPGIAFGPQLLGNVPVPTGSSALPNDRSQETAESRQDTIFRATASTPEGIEALKLRPDGRAWLASKGLMPATYDGGAK